MSIEVAYEHYAKILIDKRLIKSCKRLQNDIVNNPENFIQIVIFESHEFTSLFRNTLQKLKINFNAIILLA